jgi:hypothetical protein
MGFFCFESNLEKYGIGVGLEETQWGGGGLFYKGEVKLELKL